MSKPANNTLCLVPYGNLKVPFSDPAWYRGAISPYYRDSHAIVRDMVRQFCEKEVRPHIDEWEEKEDYPREFHEKAYRAGIYGLIWPKEYGGTPPEDRDLFHDFVYWDELTRVCPGGFLAACFFTILIALSPVLKHGSTFLKEKVCRDVITGKKIIALCVTEPGAGSDVAGIQTTARREGNHYIVNGQKKFITSGMKADFFTVAVNTGTGLSVLLLEKTMPGITLRKMKTSGWLSSNTAHIIFDDVKVPVENLIGQEGNGFKIIMDNFNMERLIGMVMANRNSRNCLEDAIEYSRVRKTFGHRLADNQIAVMAIEVESIHTMLEFVCYQLQQKSSFNIGGTLGLLKVQTTRAAEKVAREAQHIFGGNSCLRTGPGARVERITREVRIGAVGGGSEEVMLDLGVRQAKL